MNNTILGYGLVVTLIIAICTVVYLPGLGDFFVADDKPNISENPQIQINQFDYDHLLSAAKANRSGPIGRPLTSVTFGLNYYFSGQKIVPSHYKATNLAIHMVNALLAYVLSLMLLKQLLNNNVTRPSQLLAFIIAILWALHPVQLTVILYSVQRMVSLATLFMLLGLICYLAGRIRLQQKRPHALVLMYGGITLGTIFSALSKEIGLLLPYYAVVVEFTICNNTLPKTAWKKRTWFLLITAVIPAVASAIYFFTHPELLDNYLLRDFGLFERLMTEARVLFYYLGLLIYPDLHELSLYHDDIEISRHLLSPWTTLVAVLAAVTLVVMAFLFRNRFRLFSFAIAWFFVGHAMESTIFPLEIAYEHRNYLPSYGVIFGVVCIFYQIIQRQTNKIFIKTLLAATVLLSVSLTTFTRASIWSEEATIVHFDLRNHPRSVASQMMYANYLDEKGEPLPDVYEHLRIAAGLTNNEASSVIHLYRFIRKIEERIDDFSAEYQGAASVPKYYNDALVINRNYIAKLAALIDAEIQRRLQGRVASHRAAIALQDISTCIIQQHEECVKIMPETMKWLAVIEKNPGHTPTSIARVYFTIAKLKAFGGDMTGAIDYLNKSISIQPGNNYLLIERVNLYLTIEDLDNARQLIQELERRDDLPKDIKESLGRSKQYYLDLLARKRTESG